MNNIKTISMDKIFEKVSEPKVQIEIDPERLRKEIGRLKKYLSSRHMKDYQIITTMQDLGVLINTNNLSRVDIINQLEVLACTYRPSRRMARNY